VVDGRGASAFPPPRTLDVRPTNLPARLPILVGREDELRAVRHALLAEGERLVTLTGRGGAGKTSVALAVAAELLDEHPAGVWLARLADVPTAAEVLPAVAAVLGAEGDAGAFDAVVARLRDRGPALLVIDNLEHLMGAAATIRALLDAVPNLRVLATSQVPLHLPSERVLPLDALNDEAGVALIERVARRRGAVMAGDRQALLELVWLLDGLPLALELAAARLALLTPAQLVTRLRESTDVLADTRREGRQRSLRATVEWSLAQLEEAPTALFARVGVFAAPVELEELEAVLGTDLLDPLTDLLDASPDGPAWRRRHAQHQYELAWRARWLGMSSGADYRRATAAFPEAAAALAWARGAGDPIGPPLAAAYGALLMDNGRIREGEAAIAPLLARPIGDPNVDALAQLAHGYRMLVLGRLDEVLATSDRATALSDDASVQAVAYAAAGFVHTVRGEHEQAVACAARTTAIARTIGPAAHGGALVWEAQACAFAGQLERGTDLLAEARRIGGPVDAKQVWHVETVHGDIAAMAGRHPDALAHYAASMERATRDGDGLQVMFDLYGVALALASLREDDAALEVRGMAEAQSADVGGPDAELVTHMLEPVALDAAAERAGAAAVAELTARGRAVPAGQRVVRAAAHARRPR
jgi:predicted ATPase